MRRLLGLAYLAVFVTVMLLTWSAPQALANHVQCGDVITQDTTLDSDLIDCPVHGIVIGADDITLRLAGHTIEGNAAGVGVMNDAGHDGVTVRGGVIEGFFTSILLENASGNRVVGNSTFSARDGIGIAVGSSRAHGTFDPRGGNRIALNTVPEGGIIIGESNGNLIDHNTVSHNGIIVIASASGNRVVGNSVSDPNGYGIYVYGAPDNRIEDNSVAGGAIFVGGYTATGNIVKGNSVSGAAIVIYNTSGHRIERNLVSGASEQQGYNIQYGPGIILQDGHRNSVSRNHVFGNRDGIAMSVSSDDNVVERNTVFGNSRSGIVIFTAGTPNRIERNAVVRNGEDGIRVAGDSSGTSIKDNRAVRNGDDGVDVDNPATTLSRNAAYRNGDLGIEAVPGATDEGGNRAFENGNPLQCVNVFCR